MIWGQITLDPGNLVLLCCFLLVLYTELVLSLELGLNWVCALFYEEGVHDCVLTADRKQCVDNLAFGWSHTLQGGVIVLGDV